ncbi:MAG: hypothetical protein HS099_21160 [Ardenticatenaceae bacterium]|nr:hypothetical protein [Ardenticatenaceae bacterium]
MFLHGKQLSRLSHPYRSTHMLGRDGAGRYLPGQPKRSFPPVSPCVAQWG